MPGQHLVQGGCRPTKTVQALKLNAEPLDAEAPIAPQPHVNNVVVAPIALQPVVEEPAVFTEDDVAIPMSERVTIMDLRESMCRWPMGDPTKPEFRFCGARSITGLPYCTHHARIAYQPVADRKRERRLARA